MTYLSKQVPAFANLSRYVSGDAVSSLIAITSYVVFLLKYHPLAEFPVMDPGSDTRTEHPCLLGD